MGGTAVPPFYISSIVRYNIVPDKYPDFHVPPSTGGFHLKFLHISDLHIGKSLHGFSLLEDQKYILEEILGIAREHGVDAILVAGDVLDSTRAGEDAFGVYNWFMTQASEFPIYVIPGNHDPAEKLGCCRSLMRDGVHVCGPYCGKAEKHTVEDEYGELNIFLLPYIKTSSVRHFYGDDESISTPEAAFAKTMEASEVDPSARNILVCHQFVVGGGIDLRRSDSEACSIFSWGGADCMSYGVLNDFDYVALGHIHGPQSAGRPEVRYCGSPLKYSESEGPKTATIVEVGEKGHVDIEEVPLVPLRDLICVRGTTDEILAQSDSFGENYVCATVTGDTENAREKLSSRIPNLMHVDYNVDAGRLFDSETAISIEEIRSDDMEGLFSKFYMLMMNSELTESQTEILKEACRRVEEGMQ